MCVPSFHFQPSTHQPTRRTSSAPSQTARQSPSFLTLTFVCCCPPSRTVGYVARYPTICVLTRRKQRQSQDTKLSDPFYDSLEGLLQDLRTITPVCVLRACRFIWALTRVFVKDNRDAEAFLKPVSRADVPDYYDGVLTCIYAHGRANRSFIHLSHC